MPGIGIIANPHSKLNRRNPETSKLLGYIVGEHGRLEVTKSLQDLERVAHRFEKSNIDIVAVNGGDGTVSKSLSSIIKAYGTKPLPKIALLRGGTMNVLANNIGIYGNPAKILFRLCEAYAHDYSSIEVRKVRTLRVGDDYGFMYADGLAYNVLREFYRNKTNVVGVAFLVAKIALSALVNGPFYRALAVSRSISIKTDKRSFEAENLILIASTLRKLPFGIPIFNSLGEDLHAFQYVVANCSSKRFLRNLLSFLLVTSARDSGVKIGGLAQTLSISTLPSYNYSMDGELLDTSSGQLTLELGPEIEFLIV